MSSTHVEALELLLRKRACNSAELKTALGRLSSELRHRLQTGSVASVHFVESSVRVLCRIKGSTHAAVLLECLCDSAQFLYSNGRSADALKAARRCEELARLGNNTEWLAKAEHLVGIVSADLGNVGEALIYYSRALNTARDTNDLAREVTVLNCVGVAYNYGGLYRHAIPCFQRALQASGSKEFAVARQQLGVIGDEYRRGALTNKAQSHLELGEYNQGFADIERCIAESPDPWDALSTERRVIREATFVRLALEVGKLAVARRHAADARRYSTTATQRARFYCDVTLALCEVHGGDVSSGLLRLESLLSKSHSPPERARVLADLVRSYDEIGNPEQALDRVHQLIGCLRTMRTDGLFATLSVMPDGYSAAVGQDPLEVREAMLRAKVSERRLAQQQIEMFERLAIAADLREEDSGKHGYRVGKLAALLAKRVCWSAERCIAIESAARLHDIGKIAMPDRILLSSKVLNGDERLIIAAHAQAGAELLSKGNTPELRMAEEIARCHHERWDGNGYPTKISGKRIPIAARIVSLADVFDALTHGRPYAPAWTIDRALEEIRQRRGTQFDPDLTDVFLTLIGELRAQHADLDAFLAEASRNSPFLQAREKIRLMLEGARAPENIAAAAAETVH